MSMRARKVCSTIGCSEITPCPMHPKIAWEGSTRRSELPPGWSSRIVPRILRRDPVCTDGVVCGDENGVPMALSVAVHHIGRPDQHGDAFLRGICSDCHAYRTAQQAAAGRRA